MFYSLWSQVRKSDFKPCNTYTFIRRAPAPYVSGGNIYIYIFPGYTFDAAQRRINLATLTWNCHVDFSCDLDFFSIMRKGVEFTIFCDHCNAFSMYIFYFMTA